MKTKKIIFSLITLIPLVSTLTIASTNIDEIISEKSLWRQKIPKSASYLATTALQNSDKVWIGDGFALISTSPEKKPVTISYKGGYGVISSGKVTLNIGHDFLIPKGSDRAVAVIDRENGMLWDFWKIDEDQPGPNRTAVRGVSSKIPSLAHAKKLTAGGRAVPAGIRAAWVWTGVGLLEAEHYSGTPINHALAASLNTNQLKSGFIDIAVAQDSDGETTYKGTIPMGTHFAIPHTVDITKLNLTTIIGKNIADAAQKYGIYIVDRHGGDAELQLYSNPANVTESMNEPLKHWWKKNNQDLIIIKKNLRIVSPDNQ